MPQGERVLTRSMTPTSRPAPVEFTGLFPSGESRTFALLTVLLGSEPAARAAWARWLQGYRFDRLDSAHLRLLMMALPTLARYGLRVPDRPRLEGLVRRTRCTNGALWKAVAELCDLLGQQGIPVMLLKGLPLSTRIYGPGERFALDADVLLRRSDYDRARAVLERHPTFVRRDPETATDPDLKNGEEWRLGIARVDVHTRLCHEFAPLAEAEERLWHRAQPIADVPANLPWRYPPLMPATEDMLLQLAVSQTRRDRMPHGLVDAARLLTANGASVDWAVLVEEADAYRVSLRTAALLEFLRDDFDADVPEDVIGRLRRAAKRYEARELGSIVEPARWHALIRYWYTFRRRDDPDRMAALRPLRFARFVLRVRGRPSPLGAARQTGRYVLRTLMPQAK